MSYSLWVTVAKHIVNQKQQYYDSTYVVSKSFQLLKHQHVLSIFHYGNAGEEITMFVKFLEGFSLTVNNFFFVIPEYLQHDIIFRVNSTLCFARLNFQTSNSKWVVNIMLLNTQTNPSQSGLSQNSFCLYTIRYHENNLNPSQ